MSRIEPVGPGDAVRARVPDALSVHAQTRATVLQAGVVDQEIKDLCFRYLHEDDEVVVFEGSDRFDDRQKTALRWAHAIAWDSDTADEALWKSLHEHFSEPELVDLGYAIALALGQAHWLRTLGIAPELDR
ncbi:MAG TPA: hypothetical protein VFE45_03400 [Coriobacteriia bacterium]|nr:hypothetical protein [Coriobacteriia bacterium]